VKLDRTLALGYRRIASGAGQWVADVYLGGRKYKRLDVGPADDQGDADGVVLSFAQAQERARAVRAEYLAGPKTKPFTVRDAIERWLPHVEARGSKLTAKNARYDFNKWVAPLYDAELEAPTLTPRLRDLFNLIARTPAQRGRKKPGAVWTGPDPLVDHAAGQSRRSTANTLRANLFSAFNLAVADGLVSDDRAWRRIPAFANARRTIERRLTVEQLATLLNVCRPDLGEFVIAAVTSALRYSELEHLVVSDFDRSRGTLKVRHGKGGKSRVVPLAPQAVEFFMALTTDRVADETMLMQDTRWGRRHWSQTSAYVRLKAACSEAGIEPGVSPHDLRRTHASLAAESGLSLQVIQRCLGHSSTRVTERHYTVIRDSVVADAVKSFPVLPLPANVIPLRPAAPAAATDTKKMA
jgi:integrase